MLAKLSVHPALYALIYSLPIGVVVNYHQGGWRTFGIVIIIFGWVAGLDLIFGVNKRNPSPDEEKALVERKIYRYLTWGLVPTQALLTLWACWVVSHHRLTIVELVGFTLSVGVTGGVIGINVSHELIHRVNNRLEPMLGRIMLLTVCYTHWAVEHVIGHHKNVATHDDPATSRFGESIYEFLPRTVIGGFKSAWRLEKERLAKKGKFELGFGNRIVLYGLIQIVIIIGIAKYIGFWALMFFFVQSAIAIGLLEIVNYLEHYGLERKKDDAGVYEKVSPKHSWNASNWLSNFFLFNLQRHSDHHARPGARYQILRHFDESPQLPTGYAGMVLVALVPPIWRAVMDKRVAARKQLSK